VKQRVARSKAQRAVSFDGGTIRRWSCFFCLARLIRAPASPKRAILPRDRAPLSRGAFFVGPHGALSTPVALAPLREAHETGFPDTMNHAQGKNP
jgi:hypothetical protein